MTFNLIAFTFLGFAAVAAFLVFWFFVNREEKRQRTK